MPFNANNTRPTACSCDICSENFEALLVLAEIRRIYRSPNPQVFVFSKRIELTTKAMMAEHVKEYNLKYRCHPKKAKVVTEL